MVNYWFLLISSQHFGFRHQGSSEVQPSEKAGCGNHNRRWSLRDRASLGHCCSTFSSQLPNQNPWWSNPALRLEKKHGLRNCESPRLCRFLHHLHSSEFLHIVPRVREGGREVWGPQRGHRLVQDRQRASAAGVGPGPVELLCSVYAHHRNTLS